MSMSFSVRVVDEDGNPREGVRIYSHYGILHGGHAEYTDEEGWATFEPSGDYTSVEIMINGDSQGEYSISDSETFSFTL